MQFKKLAATALGAILAGSTLGAAASAASTSGCQPLWGPTDPLALQHSCPSGGAQSAGNAAAPAAAAEAAE